MAYLTSSPPALLTQRIGGGAATWAYSSSDPAATVDTSGYISNGDKLGMKVGDIVNVIDTITPLVTTHRVAAVSTAGADLGTGTTIGSSANAD
jgi:hypothetical protein